MLIPKVPKRCAVLLLTAGVQPSYSQLAAAARSEVAGVENWLQACASLPKKMGVKYKDAPLLAQKVLTDSMRLPRTVLSAATRPSEDSFLQGSIWQRGAVRKQELEDLLFFTVNMAAEAAALMLISMLTEAEAVKQVYKSVQQQSHYEQWQQEMLEFLQQHMPLPVKLQLLTLAYRRQHYNCARLLENLPGWPQLPVRQAVQFLQEAVQSGNADLAHGVTNSPAADTLDAAQVTPLLEAAVQSARMRHGVLAVLARKYSRLRIEPASMAALLAAALQQGGFIAVASLATMDAARGLEAAAVGAIFDQAVQRPKQCTSCCQAWARWGPKQLLLLAWDLHQHPSSSHRSSRRSSCTLESLLQHLLAPPLPMVRSSSSSEGLG